jgi:chromosomal replication initiator protein
MKNIGSVIFLLESFQQSEEKGSFEGTKVEVLSEQTNNIHELWQKTKNLIKTRLHATSYETVISRLEPISYTKKILTLACPSETIKQWAERRYIREIMECAKHFFSDIIDINFLISEEPPDVVQHQLFKNVAGSDSVIEIPFPRHTFENFVVAESNEFPYATALAVAEEPGNLYNPLFIYGGVGLGKTHLLHAINNYIVANHRNLKVRYVTAEKFTNEFIQALKERTVPYFHKKYREVDVLLVDDIQFLQGKESTQEEFFHTFNSLYEAGNQIVISSDRPPKSLSALEDRLVSRFEHGLIADIQPPNLETRIAILYKKAEMKNIYITSDVALAIAERVTSNIRELEGALNRVIAYSQINKLPLNVELVEKVLAETFPRKARKPVSISKIQNAVCSYFNISKADLIGNKRSSSIVYARHIAIYLARTLTDESLPAIGKNFGGRDHSTVLYAYERIQTLMKEQRQVLDHVNNLIRIIQGEN